MRQDGLHSGWIDLRQCKAAQKQQQCFQMESRHECGPAMLWRCRFCPEQMSRLSVCLLGNIWEHDQSLHRCAAAGKGEKARNKTVL